MDRRASAPVNRSHQGAAQLCSLSSLLESPRRWWERDPTTQHTHHLGLLTAAGETLCGD